nr:YihY/virulence factor BrkB family protein [Actinomycetota bacterium]
VAWSIPRHHRPNPFRARLRSLLLVATAGVAVVTTTVLSVLAGSTEDGQMFAGPLAILAAVAAFAINAAVFVAVFRISAATTLSVRAVLPGAVIGALIWQLVQIFGTVYARTVVANASATYGVFALVLGLMAWIFLATSGVVLGVEVNVVRAKRLYPRALLTLFTDNVDLTGADRRAYTDAVIAQRHKAFQSIEVDFEDEGQQATARKLAAQASASVAERDEASTKRNEDTARDTGH